MRRPLRRHAGGACCLVVWYAYTAFEDLTEIFVLTEVWKKTMNCPHIASVREIPLKDMNNIQQVKINFCLGKKLNYLKLVRFCVG